MKTFHCDLLRVHFYISFAKTEKEADAELSKALGVAVAAGSGDADGYVTQGHRQVAMWIPKTLSRREVLHECFHATLATLATIYAKGEDEELNAHIHEWIADRVLTLWEEKCGRR